MWASTLTSRPDWRPRAKRKAAYHFLAGALGFEDLSEDLAAIAIEPPEVLAVFDAAHPLPPNALRGSDAIAAAFARLAAKN